MWDRLVLSAGLAGCGPSAADLEAVDYTQLPGADWQVSTPAEQGLDPDLVAKLLQRFENGEFVRLDGIREWIPGR
jgi:hypothetical protein